ncbi:MAG: flavodoxin family protein [Candidatus Coproplasma sp.]
MRLKVFKVLLLILTIFIGAGAFEGGICMLIKPDGSLVFLDTLLPYFQVLPFADVLFQDYVFSGIMLIIVNGITNVIATVLILKNKRIGYVLGTVFGLTLMLWITIQFIIFPFYAIDLVFFILGFLQLVFGYVALVSFNQVNFVFNEEDYKDIDKNSKTLVVYFSRKKFTKKLAYVTADGLKADIAELRTKERTEGDLGFWWCGRFAMHRWGMELLPEDFDLSKYDNVVIVSPIWVFRACAPIRQFIIDNKDVLKGKNLSLIFNHFNPWLPKGAVKEVEKYIDVKEVKSYTTMLGHTFGLKG